MCNIQLKLELTLGLVEEGSPSVPHFITSEFELINEFFELR